MRLPSVSLYEFLVRVFFFVCVTFSSFAKPFSCVCCPHSGVRLAIYGSLFSQRLSGVCLALSGVC